MVLAIQRENVHHEVRRSAHRHVVLVGTFERHAIFAADRAYDRQLEGPA